MGTGSAGGGGSGGKGGGSGGGSSLAGGYRFDKKNKTIVISDSHSEKSTKKQKREYEKYEDRNLRIQQGIRQQFRRMPKPYLAAQFGSPLVSSIYKQLDRFGVTMAATTQNPCEELEAIFEIDPGKRFLPRWVNQLMEAYQDQEYNAKVRSTARMALEDFLIESLDNNLDLYLEGTCYQILQKINQIKLANRSSFYLGYMIWRVLEREFERQPARIQNQIREAGHQLAKQIIDGFSENLTRKDVPQTMSPFEDIDDNMDRLLHLLRGTQRE